MNINSTFHNQHLYVLYTVVCLCSETIFFPDLLYGCVMSYLKDYYNNKCTKNKFLLFIFFQDPAWKYYIWKKTDTTRKVKRKFHFRQIARAVKFTAKLFSRALSKRVRATILYASETGKSEHYAKNLAIIFGHAFNTQVSSEFSICSFCPIVQVGFRQLLKNVNF